MRHQLDVTVPAAEGLDGGLAVDHRRDDVAVLGHRLLPDHHPVAVGDRGVDHRVADHPEQEQGALADQVARERKDVLDGLLGQDRAARRDPADDRHIGGWSGAGRPRRPRRPPRASGCPPRADGWGPCAADPLRSQHGQLVGHRRRRLQPDHLADLADARRVAATGHRVADHREYLLLAHGQRPAVVLVGEFADRALGVRADRPRRRSGRPRLSPSPASRPSDRPVTTGALPGPSSASVRAARRRSGRALPTALRVGLATSQFKHAFDRHADGLFPLSVRRCTTRSDVR